MVSANEEVREGTRICKERERTSPDVGNSKTIACNYVRIKPLFDWFHEGQGGRSLGMEM